MKKAQNGYVALSLLLIALIAVLIGVIALTRHKAGVDAGFDVITYLSCPNEDLGYSEEIVIVREGDGLAILMYDYIADNIIQRGEPTDLSYFSRVPIGNSEELPFNLKWEELVAPFNTMADWMSDTLIPPAKFAERGSRSLNRDLNRGDGYLTSITVERGSNTPHCFSDGQCSTPTEKRCEYGEKAKAVVWENALNNYEDGAPKF